MPFTGFAHRLVVLALILFSTTAPALDARLTLLGSQEDISHYTPFGSGFLYQRQGNFRELWRTDGTPGGTTRIASIGVPRPRDPLLKTLAVVGDKAFLTAETSQAGEELWISDGTESGTRLLIDLQPGVGSSYPRNFLAAGSRLHFAANLAPTATWSTWMRSDGTVAGTLPVVDSSGGTISVGDWRSLGSLVIGINSPFGDLWSAEALAGPATKLGSFRIRHESLQQWNGRLYFISRSGASWELWCTDGSRTGTLRLTTLMTAPREDDSLTSSLRWILTSGGDRLIVNRRTYVDDVLQSRLWRTDGTINGTASVHESLADGSIDSMAWFNGRFIAAVTPFDGGTVQLRSYDGDFTGSTLLYALSLPPAVGGSIAVTAIRDGRAWFTARTIYSIRNRPSFITTVLSSTDGTAAGTRSETSAREVDLLQPLPAPGKWLAKLVEDTPTSIGRLFYTWHGALDLSTSNSGGWITMRSPRHIELAEGQSTVLEFERSKATAGSAETTVGIAFGDGVTDADATIPTPTSLTWGDGENGIRTMTIAAILDTTTPEASETLVVGLPYRTAGALIDHPSETSITITNVTGIQSITFPAIPDQVFGASPIALSATASSGLPVVFNVVSGPATLSGGSLTLTGVGIVTITADQSGNASWAPASTVTRAFTVGKGTQTIAFTAPADRTFESGSSILEARASSGLPVSFSVLSGPATVHGATLSFTGAGAVTIAADQPGDAFWSAASRVTRVMTIGKGAQTIAFTGPTDRTYNNGSLTLEARASSSLPVSFSVLSGPATVRNQTLTFTGVGTVTIAADQAGDAQWSAAPRVTRTMTISKGQQIIAFVGPGPQTWTGTPVTATLNASTAAGLPVTFTITAGPATVMGRTLTITGAGTVSIAADQEGDALWNAAARVTRTIEVTGKTAQVITFPEPGAQTWNSTPIVLSLTASSSSGLPVSYVVLSGPATVANATLTITGPGAVIIAADQAGDAMWAAAPQVMRTIDVGKAAQTIAFPDPGAQIWSGAAISLPLTANASSGLPVSYIVISGPATVAGTTLTITGDGVVVVQATQGGDATWQEATPVERMIMVTPGGGTAPPPTSTPPANGGGGAGGCGAGSALAVLIGMASLLLVRRRQG